MRSLAFREIAIVAAIVSMSSSAFADDPQPETSEASEQPQAATASGTTETAEAPPPAPTLDRKKGVRLGLDLGFSRAVGKGDESITTGSPSLIPLGLAVSWRTSPKMLLGAHGHAALASRDDCGTGECTARGYGLGIHAEHALTSGPSFVPWIRYGSGWEVLYRGGLAGGTDGYLFRHAFDMLDLRFGGDFVVARGQNGKTTRIGPYVGAVAGLTVAQSGAFNDGRSDINRGAGDPHLWLGVGFRATTDP